MRKQYRPAYWRDFRRVKGLTKDRIAELCNSVDGVLATKVGEHVYIDLGRLYPYEPNPRPVVVVAKGTVTIYLSDQFQLEDWWHNHVSDRGAPMAKLLREYGMKRSDQNGWTLSCPAKKIPQAVKKYREAVEALFTLADELKS